MRLLSTKDVVCFSAIVFLLSAVSAFAQPRNISGTVLSETGEPVVGAAVVVRGTSAGTATGPDGSFHISAQKGAVLEFSCIGYESALATVSDESLIHVVLNEDSNLLNELVVVGYAVQKKVNLTGAVATVSSKEIENIPVANTTTLLQGRLPGVVLTSNGAQAGADNPEIRIRGIGTFGTNDPTVIIDGVEAGISQLAELPSADIENISVLKDAASAAIYGVRAANGVILVTTKRGTPGRVRVTFNNAFSLHKAVNVPDYVDGYNWALMRNEVQQTYDEKALDALKNGTDPYRYANTDWLQQVLRTAQMHQHHLSVSGGSEDTHFMTSVTYSDQDGIMKNTGVERIGFRSNVDTRLKRFTFGMNLSGNKNAVEAPAVSPSGEAGIMRYVSWFTRPTVPTRYADGHFGYADGSWTEVEAVKNPLELMALGNRTNNTWRLNGKVFAGLDLIDGLKFQTSFAYNFNLTATKTYSPKDPERYDADGIVRKAAGATNRATDYYWRDATWTNENLLTYNKEFGKHSVSMLLGHSIIGSRYYVTSASIQGFPTENIYELNGGTTNPYVSGYSEEYRLQSFFGRVNYSFADRYLLEVNVRRDGSSRMPKSHRYATFPSVSAGWVFSNEDFFKHVSFISFGKLRASWGTLGNQEIGNYAYTANLGASGNYFFAEDAINAGMVQTSIPNEDIRWEITKSFDLGIDLAFFSNRIQTTFDWYNKNTYDILMRLSMPGIFLGSLPAPYQNAGTVRNRGWEWDVNYHDGKGDWRWTAGFNVARVRNEIREMGGLKEAISGNTINRIGEPIGAYYGYKSLGIIRTESDLAAYKNLHNGVAPQLGDIMYEDLDEDNNITAADRQIIGNPFPKFSFGFNLGVSWKNVDLSTFWQGVSGIYRYNWETTTGICGNMTSRWSDRWSADNPNGTMPVLGHAMNDSYSSFWLEKSDYLRLKNLELGYTMNQPFLNKAGLSSVRIYFSGTNLLTFTPMKDWDPEKSSGDQRNDMHPNAKAWSLGINFVF